MSAITDILDRLSGVAVVREKLGETARRVDQLADRVLDQDRRFSDRVHAQDLRIARVEAFVEVARAQSRMAPARSKRLTKKTE